MGLLDSLPFNGYKTYLCIIGAALVLGLESLGYIDPATMDIFLKILGLSGAASLAHKIDKARG